MMVDVPSLFIGLGVGVLFGLFLAFIAEGRRRP